MVTIGDKLDNDVTTPASFPALKAYPNMMPPNEPMIVAATVQATPLHVHSTFLACCTLTQT
jgi:hypothetical protein